MEAENLSYLICGLAFTSRTETVENYLRDRGRSLTVISISSCFLRENFSSCRIYDKGALRQEFKIPNFRIKDYKWYRQPLILFVFIINWISIAFCLIKLKKRYDIYIGVSHSFAFLGSLLKRLGVVEAFIYYSIDYYIPTSKIKFNNLFIKLINIIDTLTVKNADCIWNLSDNIPEFREKIGKIKKETYKNILVPLGYSKSLRKFKTLAEINRWDIGFVGTISTSQGLQLLVEALPDLLKTMPQLRVKIIGEGPFLNEFKKMVSQNNLDNYFTFFGFIKSEEMVWDIISRCAIGVALWDSPLENKNIICADPGKTKLYAMCGTPVVITKFPTVAKDIQSYEAGVVIDYNRDDLIKAIIHILDDEERLKKYKENAMRFSETCISETMFEMAFQQTLVNY